MSKLQDLARKRNSAKGRVKGLRNNIRGLLNDSDVKEYLSPTELEQLQFAEQGFDNMLTCWDHHWDEIKEDL